MKKLQSLNNTAFFIFQIQIPKPPIASPMANFHKSKSDYDDRRRFCCYCKRHPKHRQSPGVCSLCLTEKLSQILSATTSSSRKISDSLSSAYSSSSSYYSSASSCSSCSSPDRGRKPANFVFSASSIFKKSRSMRILRRGGATESDIGGKKSTNNLGFWWSRFLNRPPRRKRPVDLEKVFTHSRTVVLQRNVHG